MRMPFTCCSKSRSFRVFTNRWAARHGPSVWELDGPTPILRMSNTDIASCDKVAPYDSVLDLDSARLNSSRYRCSCFSHFTFTENTEIKTTMAKMATINTSIRDLNDG